MLRYIPHGFINAKPRKDILAEMARDGKAAEIKADMLTLFDFLQEA